ncbi:hypothetical protein AB6A23_02685 [Paenibacillus tarimensis]
MMSGNPSKEVKQPVVVLDVVFVLEQLGITQDKLPQDLSSMILHKKNPL